MGRRSKATGKSVGARHRGAAAPKRRNPPKRRAAVAGETEVARLKRELAEALEQQTATAEILQVISGSASDLQPVFESVLANAVRLCAAKFGILALYDGKDMRIAALHNPPPRFAELRQRDPVIPLPQTPLERLVRTRKPVNTADLKAEPRYAKTPLVKLVGARGSLCIPMLRGKELIGAITIYRLEPGLFSKKHIELLTNFARQAVIAIENARLLTELRARTDDLTESLEQQTATSEVLQVISASPGDLEPVFAAMLQNAVRICDAKFGNIYRWDNGVFHLVATHNTPPALVEHRRRSPIRPNPKTLFGRMMVTKAVIHIADLAADALYKERIPETVSGVEFGGIRTVLAVPMLKENELVGAFTVYRQEVRPFTDKQVALVTSFAAQAVIAIENTRLLTELRQRTDDLTESLEQQTAISEVLRVISNSPSDVKPVLDTVAEYAARICEAQIVDIMLLDGNMIRGAAQVGELGRDIGELPVDRSTVMGRSICDLQPVHLADQQAAGDDFARGREFALRFGHRTILSVPLIREGRALGAILVRRTEVRPFSDKHIALLKTFADQAAIAIENVRLFEAEQQRTRELSESLEQQTAMSEVLDVISRSAFDLNAVFETVVERSARLTGVDGARANIFRFDGELLRIAATFNVPPKVREWLEQHPLRPGRHSGSARAALERRTIHVPDVLADPEYTYGAKAVEPYRTILAVPILKANDLLGVLLLYLLEVKPFTAKQIALVETFADQAAIAIENVRLFEAEQQRTRELGESLERQTATSEVLRVISSSPGDLAPVFETILENATRLCEASFGILFLTEGDGFRTVAWHNVPPEFIEAQLTRMPVVGGRSNTTVGRVAATKRPAQSDDIWNDPAYIAAPERLAILKLSGARTMLCVPMLKDDELVGQIAIYRTEVRPFADKQIEIVTNFAAQAVIAIENTRLLTELRESLEQQTATADVLRVISSSPGELEPVFNAMLENATRICGAKFGVLFMAEGETAFRMVAGHGIPPEFLMARRREPVVAVNRNTVMGRVAATKQPFQLPDVQAEPAYANDPSRVTFLKLTGARTVLNVPMLKDGALVGQIAIYRTEVRPFGDKEIALLTNFAAQAVIAIENTRLLSELRQRTDDLTESLEQQTATSEVLSAISGSRGELAPVFETMLENATRICGAQFGNLLLREGDALRIVAMHGARSEWSELRRREPTVRPPADDPLGRLIATRQLQHVTDVRNEPAYIARTPGAVAAVELGGLRTLLAVPILKDDELVGAFAIYRHEVRPFTDKQIALVQSFAAQAVIAIENTRLLTELRESLEQQTATSEVLRVISSSPGDLQPVFDAMLQNAVHICDAKFGNIYRWDGERMQVAAAHNTPPAFAEARARAPLSRGDWSLIDRILANKEAIQVADVKALPGYLDRSDTTAITAVELGGVRTQVSIPMLKENEVVGLFSLFRDEVRPFTEKQIALVTSFASQAVIAIENARLLNELRQRTDDLTESLEQQTATSEVLRVISSSPGDLEPVFATLLEKAVGICGASFGNIYRWDGALKIVASLNTPPAFAEARRRSPFNAGPKNPMRQMLETKTTVHIPDILASEAYIEREPVTVEGFELAGIRTFLAVPMLKENELIGGIALARQQTRAFSDKQIALVANFAAQAVIAIENARLVNELRRSLERQTATADILRIISQSPTDARPAFEGIAVTAARLLQTETAIMLRDGNTFSVVAGATPEGPHPDARLPKNLPIDADANFPSRAMIDGTMLHQPDWSLIDLPEHEVKIQREFGLKSALYLPLLRQGESIGLLTLLGKRPNAFGPAEIAQAESFRDQALIAIENTRLFNELRQSLEQQTATSEVLSVISSSPGDLQPVFDSMLQNATRLCGADFGVLTLCEGDAFRMRALHNMPTVFVERWEREPVFRPSAIAPLSRAIASKELVHIADVRRDTAYTGRDPPVVSIVDEGGVRSLLVVPMLKEGQGIGALSIYRREVRPFSDKQIELVRNFAAQAVIAIENTRLLTELRESLEQQTATADVLRVISSSPGELTPVFQTILANAIRICDAKFGTMWRHENGQFEAVALAGTPVELVEFHRQRGLVRPGPGSGLDRLLKSKDVIRIDDEAAEPTPSVSSRLAGARSLIVVPVLKDQELIGAISIYRQEVRPFTDKQVQLVQSFAAQAVIAIENARLLSELRESLEQQTATAEVLGVINASRGDLQPVFEAMVEKARRLCEADAGHLALPVGDDYRSVAVSAMSPEMTELIRSISYAPGRGTAIGRALAERRPVQISDIGADNEHVGQEAAHRGFIRTILGVPLLREGEAIGAFGLSRQRVEPFSDRQIDLVRTFADQAVIAIENVRLFEAEQQRTKELTESLAQQTATADVLRVISSSQGELQPVFAAILENATRICTANFGVLSLKEGEDYRVVGMFNAPPSYAELRRREPTWRPSGPIGEVIGQAFASKRAVQIADAAARDDPLSRTFTAATQARSMIIVPMLKEGEPVGVFTVYRTEVRPFTDRQVELLTNFAAQAVIAIENARLLSELRESLEQQTATSKVLEVISSSPGDLQPVFAAILENATRICEANFANLVVPENGAFRGVAMHNAPESFAQMRAGSPVFHLRPSAPLARVAATKQVLQVDDLSADPSYREGDPGAVRFVDTAHVRTILIVPMLKEEQFTGAIVIYRQEIRPFTEKQIALVASFAAQAVIAIENARLLSELRESLEQQTATSEVLQVINRSRGDLLAVFDAMLEKAMHTCRASFGVLATYDGTSFRTAATRGVPEAYARYRRDNPPAYGPGTGPMRVLAGERVVHELDLMDTDAYRNGEPNRRALVDLGGARSSLHVGLFKDQNLLGTIQIYRQEVRPFSDKESALLENFGAQAAIAIENARLLNELRARTDELSRSVGELRALGEVSQAVNSTLDLENVLETIVAKAVQLSSTDAGAIYVFDEAQRDFHLRATYGMDQGLIDALSHARITAGDRNVATVLTAHEPVQSADLSQGEITDVDRIILRAGYRSRLTAPLIRGDDIVGMLVVRRRAPGSFPQNTVDLIKTFAAQSAVAIQNARLYANVETRTRELAASLADLRTAQDRLIQTEKLASLGQLTAGIAHEIKNPLNFVNNFSALSAELIDELQQIIDEMEVGPAKRNEVVELAGMLRGNLDKVVQHGKRADSIVKNMLLHSRQGSGEHQLADINAIVEESLNLAYHGARAEKQGFNITLERSFDPAAGKVVVFPQEITRVLLNLIANGFYAATKRRAETNGGDYEPTLSAATRNLGDSVEIRIRDNGTGIPPEVREKMFNPFFTTKPAGEGTGLGLSLSYDIIVKQHSGSIEVDTAPGEFTEFRIVLPRGGTAKPGGNT